MTEERSFDFDVERLDQLVRATLPAAHGKLSITRTTGGLSNPTFFLDYANVSVVLRKPPSGPLVQGAHAIDREYRVLSALQGSVVPVPAPILFHQDAELLGTPFYLMERVRGSVHRESSLPGLSPERRRAMFLGMAEMMAKVHTLDWRAIGLGDYGRPSGYAERQLVRWSRSWREHGLGDNAELDQVIAWLEKNLPSDDTVGLNHGDMRIANLMFADDGDAVVSVLDWELSTIGDPRADVAYCCLGYHMAPDENGGLLGLDLAALGIPAEDELLRHYYAAVGPGRRLQTVDLVLALFRGSAGAESVASRAVRGPHVDADAAALGRRLGKAYAQRALALIAREPPGGSLRSGTGP